MESLAKQAQRLGYSPQTFYNYSREGKPLPTKPKYKLRVDINGIRCTTHTALAEVLGVSQSYLSELVQEKGLREAIRNVLSPGQQITSFWEYRDVQ